MLNKKSHFENQKKIAENNLADRLKILKTRGLGDVEIKKDPAIRHIRAAIRKANAHIGDVAELETRIVRQAEAKAKKLAAPKSEGPKPKHPVQNKESKKARREKKMAAD